MLVVIKWGIVIVLFLGIIAYCWLLAQAYLFGKTQTKEMLERSPAHSFGLPFSAVASFGLVTILDTALNGNLDFEALNRRSSLGFVNTFALNFVIV